ncbi:MAG: hypothetical protein ACKVZH_05570 [Blastocatellia bacterium]
MSNEITNNESIITEDLNTQNADEIKGGPKKIFIGSLSVKEAATSLPDLEPRGEVKGGPAYMKLGDIKGEAQTLQTREHILLARQ